jgi:glycine C-acetyltransferase
VIENSRVLRAKLGQSGYNVTKGPHPIISVITYEAVKTQKLMDSLLDEGIFAIGLCYPLVPKGFARVRLQLNVSHIDDDIRHVVSTFEKYGEKHKILKKGG